MNPGSEAPRNGVALAIRKGRSSAAMEMKCGSGRLLDPRLKGRRINLSVVVAYAPVQQEEWPAQKTFVEELSGVMHELPRHDVRLAMGDFNARVG